MATLRKINFIAENGKCAVILRKDSDMTPTLEVAYDKDLNVTKVNGLDFDKFLSQNTAYDKDVFENEFKYCCIPAAADGNYVTLSVTVEHHFPKNTNAYSLISGDLINRNIKGELGSDDLLSQVKEAIADFEFYSEEDVKSRKFTSLVFELKYFRFSGEQFPVRVEDMSGERAFTLDKSSRLVYEFDFDNAEELMIKIAEATSTTNEQVYTAPVEK